MSAVEAVEATVEGVPAALSLAPTSAMPALGGELMLGDRRPDVDGHEGEVDRESVRAGILQAGPLALAGLVANGANVVVTVLLARLLTTRGYGAAEPADRDVPHRLDARLGGHRGRGAAGHGLAGVGQAHLVQRWARRLHRQGDRRRAGRRRRRGALRAARSPGPSASPDAPASTPCSWPGRCGSCCPWTGASCRRTGATATWPSTSLVEGGCARSPCSAWSAAGFGVGGAALGFLGGRGATAVHARVHGRPGLGREARAEEAAAGARHAPPGAGDGGRRLRRLPSLARRPAAPRRSRRWWRSGAPLVTDLVHGPGRPGDDWPSSRTSTSSSSAARRPRLSGSYAAVSVASKAAGLRGRRPRRLPPARGGHPLAARAATPCASWR